MGEILDYRETGVRHGSYAEFKATMDRVLDRVAEGFVEIGFLLKEARDTNILKESGYRNVNEFAEAEYKLDKSAVSRFIAINDRFSEGGYSPRLKEQYRGIGRAKLSLMLLLPDAVNEELTPAYSKADIQEIREEVEQEQQITDLEVLMEGKNEIQEKLENNLQRFLHQLGRDIPPLYRKVWKAYMDAETEEAARKGFMEVLAPAGEGMCSARLQGVGKMILSLKGPDRELVLINVRTQEKESYSWEQFLDACNLLMGEESAEKSWEVVYGEKFPEVAPVQPEGKRKDSKLIRPEEETQGKEEAKKAAPAAGQDPDVPEELKPEYPQKGKTQGDGAGWKEPKPERKPMELPPADAVYTVPVGKSLYADLFERGQRFLILKESNPYREGNTICLQEREGGEATGTQREIKITHLVRDHGGVTPGYCVLQFDPLPPVEKQIEGQMEIRDYGDNAGGEG